MNEESHTNGKEEPLEYNAVLIRILDGVEPEFEVLVVVLSEIQKDCRRFKDCKIVSGVVNEDWDASVGVQLQVPWFLRRA
jgi:hypothetical protein